MNWEDSILTDKQMEKATDTSRDEFWERLPDHKRADWAAQAEASFKAGYEQCAEELEVYLLKWKRGGMIEIVKWLHDRPSIMIGLEIPAFLAEWQAFLKEKGIEEEK